MGKEESPKKRITALLLAIFGGFIGLQWFYVGNYRWGSMQVMLFAVWLYLVLSFSSGFSPGGLLVLGLNFCISVASIIMILAGSLKDNKGRFLGSWQK